LLKEGFYETMNGYTDALDIWWNRAKQRECGKIMVILVLSIRVIPRWHYVAELLQARTYIRKNVFGRSSSGEDSYNIIQLVGI